ncbi:TPA: sugar ABC transporter permease [Candidatus Bathyarchaeota archaeon]|nr:sugar ABC transporter permease [Candidatus Bathyarchaeota archaeon]
MEEKKLKWLLMAPAVAILLILVIYPLLWSLGLSFYKYSTMIPNPPSFVGLQNYIEILNDPKIWHNFKVTAHFMAIAIPAEFLLGFGIALLLYEEFKGRRIVITLLLIPMMLAPIAVGVFYRFIFDSTFGIFTYFLSMLGVKGFRWYTYGWVIPCVALVDIWMWTPFMMLILLAGLMAVPSYLYEAAEIDRAGWFMKFRHITLPAIKPLIGIALLFRTMDALKLFDTLFILTGGGPGDASEVISLRVYREAFQYFHTGFASALSYILLVIIIVLTNIYLRFLMRRPPELRMAKEKIEVV